MKAPRGFTLIESIIVMVVMAFVMLTMTHFLVPQISQSADPHYQSRVKSLSQSLMTQILARSFDQQNAVVGGGVRCTLDGNAGSPICSGLSGAEFPLGPDKEEVPATFNDVDDFIGCWASAPNKNCDNDLYALISSGEDSAYHNFQADIDVTYHLSTSKQMIKKVTLIVKASNQAPIELIAYKGNY
ncbi:prepilin-type N-terminal cleavage/methylation domain-containing protein [Vibrio renipiscarius]|uniref:prepilin-type N-terminal cleavage/methylation domain-containing protein n=1 Tax=Vibrio renipiscarius TaxID=1461322 RepID=UPI0035510D14